MSAGSYSPRLFSSSRSRGSRQIWASTSPATSSWARSSGARTDGTLIAAVHLGHHHGLDGALLVLTALLLSRVSIDGRVLRIVLFSYLGAMFAYGAVNCVQDAWNEQLVKRGWTDSSIPSAILPSAKPIWLVVVALAVATAVVLLRENKRTSYSAA